MIKISHPEQEETIYFLVACFKMNKAIQAEEMDPNFKEEC
jgi:hypothetical protein